ncbi:MAG: type II toxin-antitoxin system VapB family antitoxin [Acidobacteriota bacterium]
MALNIKDPTTERLARELAALTKEKLTQAVRVALRTVSAPSTGNGTVMPAWIACAPS